MSCRPEPRKCKLFPSKSSNYFYERIQADYLGPFKGGMILVIIDCYSKWVEAFVVASSDSQITIEKFRECFARFGLPNTVVTDNGTQFVSAKFSKFLSTKWN